jgi:hypothetical protein
MEQSTRDAGDLGLIDFEQGGGVASGVDPATLLKR